MAGLPRRSTYPALQCPPLSPTCLSSSFAGSHCLWMQNKNPALLLLPAAALPFPVPAVRAAPFSHSVWEAAACSCRLLSDGTGMGSAREPASAGACRPDAQLWITHLCTAPALLGSCQSLLTTILCVWQWKRCCWWGTVNLVPTIPGLPASSSWERSDQKSAQHPSDFLLRGLQAI